MKGLLKNEIYLPCDGGKLKNKYCVLFEFTVT